MREALRNFQELDAQLKALEKDHLELRPERGAQPLRNAGRSTGDWGRKPPASKADQCAVRAGLPCLQLAAVGSVSAQLLYYNIRRASSRKDEISI